MFNSSTMLKSLTGLKLMNTIVKVEEAFHQHGFLKRLLNGAIKKKRKEFIVIMHSAYVLLEMKQFKKVEEKIVMLEDIECFLITDV